MLYETYHRKIEKISAVKKWFVRHRVLLIAAAAVLFALLTGCLSVKGMIYVTADVPAQIIYGENVSYEAHAFLGGVVYEYAVEGTDEWTTAAPKRVGDYCVRAKSKRIFGSPYYSKSQRFKILPKSIEAAVADERIPYGESLPLYAELMYGDRMDCASFLYEDLSTENTKVTADRDSIRITDTEGNDVTDSYRITTVTSKIRFSKRAVTITVADATAVYDGTPLSFAGCEVSKGSLAKGDSLLATFDKVRIDAGEAENTADIKVVSANGEDVTDLYDIETINGKLTVEKRPVFIKTYSAEKTYDGQPLGLADFALSPETPLVSGHRLKLVRSASLTNVGTCENLLVFKVSDGEKDVTNNYSFLFPQNSMLKVAPRKLTIQTAGANKDYDGSPLTAESYSIVSELKPLANHRLDVRFTGAQTRAGNSDNTVEVCVWTESGTDVTGNYNFDYTYGVLAVSPRMIAVRTATADFVYNGRAQSDDGCEIISPDGLAQGESLRAVLPPAITNIGTVANIYNVAITDSVGNETTDCYTVIYEYGTLTVKPCAILVTTGTAQLYYNGKEQFHDAFSVAPSIAEGQIAKVVAETRTTLQKVERLADGAFKEYKNAFRIQIFSGTEDVTFNYALTYVYGALQMLPRQIEVTTASNEFVYNGKDQSDGTFELNSPLADGHRARIKEGTPIPSLNEVKRLSNGSLAAYSNIFEIVICNGGVDVSDCYSIFYTYGTLVMKPRPLTVTTSSGSWTYDGDAHTDPKHTVTKGSLVEGHTTAVRPETVTAVTDVRRAADYEVQSVENVFRIEIACGIKDVTHNYDISYVYGVLWVFPREITFTSSTKAWEYDGLSHYDAGFNVSAGRLVTGQSASASTFATITDVVRLEDGTVGCINNTMRIDIRSGSRSVTDNYTVAYVWGTLTILPRVVEFSTNMNAWTYDALPHYDSGYRITFGGLAVGHVSAVAGEYKEITNVGSKENRFTIAVFQNTEDVSANYEILYVYGTITVSPRPISIQLINRTKSYDGTPLTSASYKTTSVLGIIDGQWTEIVTRGSQTEIGSSDNEITVCRIYSGGTDVTYNYTITTQKGKLEVVRRYLYIYAESASKIYDGTPLTGGGYTIGGIGLLSGHTLTAKTYGAQTEVGIGQNQIVEDSVSITAFGVDVSSYYNVYLRAGELHVGLREITVKTYSSEKEYDGTPLTDDRYKIIGEIIKGDTAHVTVYGSIVNSGWTPNEARIRIENAEGVDVTYCYLVTFELGTLTVTGDTGGSDINMDGSIDSEPDGSGGAGNNEVVFRATSNTSGAVYFRIKSFGDYRMTGWNNAPPYTNDYLNALELTGISLANGGKTAGRITIEPVSENISYMLPYYARNGYVSNDDTIQNKSYNSPYTIDYIPYTYSAGDIFSVGAAYEAFEREYYAYVLQTYLRLPETTRATLLDVAKKNNLRTGSASIIQDVADFVQNSVQYSKSFNAYYGDVAVYFFTKAETGICQHYATAATAMYRALGIPARYVVGFVGNMSAGTSVDVSTEQAHAWVEVYLPGAGWVQIEVTGTGDGSGSGGNETAKETLTIQPVDVYKEYDGTPLTAKNEIVGFDLDSSIALRNLFRDGYRYAAEITGSRTDYGVSESRIEKFVLYDAYGRNVTDWYAIVYKPGRIRITHTPINVHVYSLQKFYDGTPLSYDKEDYWVENLPDGFRLRFDLAGSLTDAGFLRLSTLESLPYSVYDSHDADVTQQYSLVFVGDPLTIHRRAIEITSASATKTYDGTALTSDRTWISKGYLPAGYYYIAIVSGNIIDIGTAKNEIDTIEIYNEQGDKVSRNFSITYICGVLQVIKDG